MSESYLEKALARIARQINAYDEASLMDLWELYADKVRRFEPSKKWEEAVIVLGIIQGMRIKNQLFNYNWALSRQPERPAGLDLAALNAPSRPDPAGERPEDRAAPDPKGPAGKKAPDPAPRQAKLLRIKPDKKK
ncbi:MAG: hypothetical protein PHV85_03045 [Desulfovibrionaceae bacterium]|nr:hypothetical protein [Desulfovibrionaceae bacterium]